MSSERPEQYASQQQSAAKSNAETPKVGTDERIADYTLALAVLTGVLAASTIGLWVVNYFVLRHGRESSERQLRAYIVGTTSAQIRSFHTSRPTCVLTFRNSGETPAYDVCVFTSSAVAIYPLEERPARPDGTPGEWSSVGVIGPGAEFHNEIASDVEVTAPERAGVIAGNAAFYLYGEISYRDSFGIQRTSSFCHFLAGERASRGNGPLATYHKWNEAT